MYNKLVLYTCGSPYTSEVEANRNLARTLFARPSMFSVPTVLVLRVLMGLYMYLTGEAGDARWYIWSTSSIRGFTMSWLSNSKFSCPILEGGGVKRQSTTQKISQSDKTT